MPSTVVTHISDPRKGQGYSLYFELEDDFQVVFNKMYPAQAPSSGLEHQANMRHTLMDGGSIALAPGVVACVLEGTGHFDD